MPDGPNPINEEEAAKIREAATANEELTDDEKAMLEEKLAHQKDEELDKAVNENGVGPAEPDPTEKAPSEEPSEPAEPSAESDDTVEAELVPEDETAVITCPNCGNRITIRKSTWVGGTRCPRCKTVIRAE